MWGGRVGLKSLVVSTETDGSKPSSVADADSAKGRDEAIFSRGRGGGGVDP